MSWQRNLLTQAKAHNVSRETIKRFLSYGYLPQPKNLEFHALARQADDGEFDQIGYGGTRGQAKTHAVLCQMVMDDCIRYDGLKCLYLRKIQSSAKEQFSDLFDKILYHSDFTFTPSTKTLTIKNSNSKVIFGGFKDDNQLAALIGIEYDIVAIDDTTTIPNSPAKNHYDLIRGSLRSAKKGWVPRLYASSNPGGIGHLWYKSHFVDPKTRSPQTRYVHTKLGDNKFINKEYERYLKSLKGRLGQLWREGSWDVDTEGALWSYDLIAETRIARAPEMVTIVIGVDPSGSEDGDSQGIVVVGQCADYHTYILADYTLRGKVAIRFQAVIKAYNDWQADEVIAEKNYGGDMVKYSIAQTEGGKNIPVRVVTSSRGKRLRAEPLAVKFASGEAHVVGDLPELEAEMTTWKPGDPSPNRLDAAVFGADLSDTGGMAIA